MYVLGRDRDEEVGGQRAASYLPPRLCRALLVMLFPARYYAWLTEDKP